MEFFFGELMDGNFLARPWTYVIYRTIGTCSVCALWEGAMSGTVAARKNCLLQKKLQEYPYCWLCAMLSNEVMCFEIVVWRESHAKASCVLFRKSVSQFAE